jgi:hypothetical protein
MVSIVELLFVLLTSLGLGLIPFAGPSNLLVAANLAIGLRVTDTPTLML